MSIVKEKEILNERNELKLKGTISIKIPNYNPYKMLNGVPRDKKMGLNLQGEKMIQLIIQNQNEDMSKECCIIDVEDHKNMEEILDLFEDRTYVYGEVTIGGEYMKDKQLKELKLLPEPIEVSNMIINKSLGSGIYKDEKYSGIYFKNLWD